MSSTSSPNAVALSVMKYERGSFRSLVFEKGISTIGNFFRVKKRSSLQCLEAHAHIVTCESW